MWSFGPPWPNAGEIDILEGVNDQGPNHVALHTSDGAFLRPIPDLQLSMPRSDPALQGCDMPELREQKGCIFSDLPTIPLLTLEYRTATKNTCGIGTDNVGCPVRVNEPRSYGPLFNQNEGGWYAVERTEAYIKVWFWSRASLSTVPWDIRRGKRKVDTSIWVGHSVVATIKWVLNEYCRAFPMRTSLPQSYVTSRKSSALTIFSSIVSTPCSFPS